MCVYICGYLAEDAVQQILNAGTRTQPMHLGGFVVSIRIYNAVMVLEVGFSSLSVLVMELVENI